MEALPTLILFYKGEVIERYVGYRSADELEKEVRVVSYYSFCVLCVVCVRAFMGVFSVDGMHLYVLVSA